jgi:hypothetical protein
MKIRPITNYNISHKTFGANKQIYQTLPKQEISKKVPNKLLNILKTVLVLGLISCIQGHDNKSNNIIQTEIPNFKNQNPIY